MTISHDIVRDAIMSNTVDVELLAHLNNCGQCQSARSNWQRLRRMLVQLHVATARYPSSLLPLVASVQARLEGAELSPEEHELIKDAIRTGDRDDSVARHVDLCHECARLLSVAARLRRIALAGTSDAPPGLRGRLPVLWGLSVPTDARDRPQVEQGEVSLAKNLVSLDGGRWRSKRTVAFIRDLRCPLSPDRHCAPLWSEAQIGSLFGAPRDAARVTIFIATSWASPTTWSDDWLTGLRQRFGRAAPHSYRVMIRELTADVDRATNRIIEARWAESFSRSPDASASTAERRSNLEAKYVDPAPFGWLMSEERTAADIGVQGVRRQRYERDLLALARRVALSEPTGGHARRLVEFTRLIGVRMGFSEERLRHVCLGALLSDLGRQAIPKAILHKPGPLTDEELAVIRRHPQYGSDLIAEVAPLRNVREVVLQHHERWDGRGYPLGLESEDIHLGARVFTVADHFEAFTGERPYRRGRSVEEGREYVLSQRGLAFDPALTDAFRMVPLYDLSLVAAIRRANEAPTVDPSGWPEILDRCECMA